MTDTTTPAPTPKASFLSRTSKAFGAGVGGAVAAGGAAVATAAPDGFTEAEVWTIVGAVVGGFVVAFATAYSAPANKG